MASQPINTRVGRYIPYRTGEEVYKAYLPPPLPPDPPINIASSQLLLDEANLSLGRLDALTLLLPDPPLFIYMYVRKEAVLSSQIEGTQSSLSDLLLFENDQAPGIPLNDVTEVSSYVAAMKHGLDRMRGGFPISLRLLREIHEVLLARGRGEPKTPGEFRTTQNWIGGTRPGNATYVPPPVDQLMSHLDNFEKFLHSKSGLPFLVKAALAHVQFESIHPFLDGNGRLGRLLITLLLCSEGVLREPVLYLSLFFKQNRQRYYDLLQDVRLTGNWETWIEFFLEAVAHTATQAVDAARQVVAIFQEDRARIGQLGRPAASALMLHHYLQRHPITSIAAASKQLGISVPTVTASLEHLQRLGIVKEISGKLKGRQYVYSRYIDILSQGTEPLPIG